MSFPYPALGNFSIGLAIIFASGLAQRLIDVALQYRPREVKITHSTSTLESPGHIAKYLSITLGICLAMTDLSFYQWLEFTVCLMVLVIITRLSLPEIRQAERPQKDELQERHDIRNAIIALRVVVVTIGLILFFLHASPLYEWSVIAMVGTVLLILLPIFDQFILEKAEALIWSLFNYDILARSAPRFAPPLKKRSDEPAV